MLLVPQAARTPKSASRATGAGAAAAAVGGGCHSCGRRALSVVTEANANTYERLYNLFVIDRSAVSATVAIQPTQPIKAAKAPARLPPAHTASAGSRGNHEAAHQRPRGNSARASRGRGGRDAADQCPRASAAAALTATGVAWHTTTRPLVWGGDPPSTSFALCVPHLPARQRRELSAAATVSRGRPPAAS